MVIHLFDDQQLSEAKHGEKLEMKVNERRDSDIARRNKEEKLSQSLVSWPWLGMNEPDLDTTLIRSLGHTVWPSERDSWSQGVSIFLHILQEEMALLISTQQIRGLRRPSPNLLVWLSPPLKHICAVTGTFWVFPPHTINQMMCTSFSCCRCSEIFLGKDVIDASCWDWANQQFLGVLPPVFFGQFSYLFVVGAHFHTIIFQMNYTPQNTNASRIITDRHCFFGGGFSGWGVIHFACVWGCF